MISILTGITVIFALAWGVTLRLNRASAALRHIVWTCAFGAVLLLAPLRWRVPHRVIATAIPQITAIGATTVAAASPAPASTLHASTLLLSLWILGSIGLLLRLLLNAIQFRSTVRHASGNPPVLSTPRVQGPLVAGIFRPVILLPESAGTWSISRRRAVLAHEAAHIRRRDPAILTAAHVATAIYWFHPLCWLAVARLRAESERACDDAALRLGLKPSGYATDLLELARKFAPQLALPMATTSHLESRVKSILDPMTNRSLPARATWLAAVAFTAIVLTPIATLTLRAQQSGGTATIVGLVIDPSGAVIPNAQVTATNRDTGTMESSVANPVGSYIFAGIPAGYYTIEVHVPGFAAFRLDNQVVVGGGTLRVDARLSIGSVTERMTVAAQGTPKPPDSHTVISSRPVRVGGMVQALRLTYRPDAIYPADLQAQGIQGTVLLSAVISKEGIPTSLHVLKNPGHEEFVTAALEAAGKWRYQPALLNGEPIEVLSNIEIDFKLSGTGK